MNATDLDQEERGIIDALRRARSRTEDKIPRLDEAEFRRRMKVDLGLASADTRARTVTKLRRIANLWPAAPRTTIYDGPRVNLQGTLTDLKASWKLHADDLIDQKNASGPVIRHHREAITRYCRALELDWTPPVSRYEQRSTSARSKRNEMIELPDDFVDLARALVNDVRYHKDPAVNAMFQHRARLNFYTAPRCPSEDNRLRRSDVHAEKGIVVYRVSKIAGVENEPILIPREVYDVGPHALTWPQRKSYATWDTKWRPKLIQRAQLRHGAEKAAHDYVWVHADGLPMHPDTFRQDFSTLAKTAWPGFYPYLCREVGIIVHALELVQTHGHLDLERLVQWSGHEKLDNLRKYTRKARRLLREVTEGPELNEFLSQWRSI